MTTTATTTTATPGPDAPAQVDQARIAAAIATLRGELARCDSKASLLLALTGAVLAGIISAGASVDLPAAAQVTGAGAGAGLLGATVILLVAVRPSLSGTGWPTWPDLDAEQLRAQLAAGERFDEVKVLAGIAARKFRGIKAAVDCSLAAVALLAVTAVFAAVL